METGGKMSSKQNVSSANLNALVNIIFSDIPVSEVLEERCYYRAISLERVVTLLKEDTKEFQRLSDTEDDLRVRGVRAYLGDRREYISDERNRFNIFDMLRELCSQILLLENKVVVCEYRQIYEWRKLVQIIGEEIPVTMKHAFHDMIPPGNYKAYREDFSWDYVIRQNNTSLNRMFEKGISEHHFHLWGSAPYSQVSWINLMNHLTDNQYIKYLIEIENKPYTKEKDGFIRMDSLLIMHLQAALIRLYLCCRLSEIKGTHGATYFYLKDRNLNAKKVTEKDMRILLQNPEQLFMWSSEIESNIETLQYSSKEDYVDYAMRYCPYRIQNESEERQILSGERWFIYNNIRDMYQGNPCLTDYERNLFFAYLLIQTRFRSKLVQVNDRVGFDNFQQIQNKKGFFLGDRYSTRLIARMAVRNPLTENEYFRELEARISPADTAEGNRQRILELEKAILISISEDAEALAQLEDVATLLKNDLIKKYYYVFYFLKKPDTQQNWLNRATEAELKEISSECRHYRYRKQLEKQAMGIIEFREKYPMLAQRVRGIDACSKEIGCRPENFASVFRILHHHTYTEYGVESCKLPKMGMTFHVGEDFVDVIDGLRAIDEAIHFLNLESGDRLGHALALGVDVKDWCASKNYRISIQCQDYLDNLAWLHHAIRHYQIPNQDAFLRYIEKEFEQQFNYVYRSHMDVKSDEQIMEDAERYYKEHNIICNYRKRTLNFTIEQYYRAWTLRGDHPELYIDGFFREDSVMDQWGYFKVNRDYPVREEVRYIPECSLLYYYYHYNNAVKKAGNAVTEKQLTQMYVNGVQAVQKALQKEVADRTLSIEVNPTSNVKIGTFRSYQKHPIISLYNNRLVHTKEELHACPQIQISINTDDSGVFFTSLENEYAMMARALEQLVDENGDPLFNSLEIREWLNEIRKMGNEQGFKA